eukprot:SAG22_NODE_2732_length_2271_cov_1.730203_2_plen_351_part_00
MPTDSGVRLRVATYNVHMLTGCPSSTGPGARPDAWPEQQLASATALEHPDCTAHFAAAFAALRADVIGLQEGVPHTYMQPIADELGMHLATFPSPLGRYRGLSGTLYPWGAPGHILSRFPILESRTFGHREPGTAAGAGGSGGPVASATWDGLRARLRGELNLEPTDVEVTKLSLVEATALFTRTAGAALLQLDAAGTQLLWVVNVHLHPTRKDLREQEGVELIRRITTQLQQEGSGDLTPHVLWCGDFNSEVDEAVHVAIRAAGFTNAMASVGARGLEGTASPIGPDPGQAIDHVYASPSLAGSLRKAEVVTQAGFRLTEPGQAAWVHSDHLPVAAELVLESPPPKACI